MGPDLSGLEAETWHPDPCMGQVPRFFNYFKPETDPRLFHRLRGQPSLPEYGHGLHVMIPKELSQEENDTGKVCGLKSHVG